MKTENFTKKFVSEVRNALKNHTENGATIPSKELVELLELDPKDAGTLSILVKNAFPEFEARTGMSGGWGRVGVEAAPRVPSFPDGFVEEARRTLETLTAMDAKGITRKVVAEAMGKPGSDTENRISKAFHAGLLGEYHSVKGPDGGFRRGPRPESDATEESAPVETASTETRSIASPPRPVAQPESAQA